MIKHTNRITSVAIAALLATAFAGAPAMAADQRTIVVDSAEASLDFQFNPVKPAFDFSEPLEFTLRSNQDVFLYIYSVTAEGDYALILPNNMQKHNKYPANTTMQVPNSNVAFRADGSVSSEPVYAIASTRYIDLELAKQRRAGDFSVIGAKDMRERFGSKGIVLRELEPGETQVQIVTETPDTQTGSTTVSVSNDQPSGAVAPTAATESPAQQPVLAVASMVRVDVPIENIPAPAPAPSNNEGPEQSDPVVTFVATDRADYKRGDTVHIVFGASRPGQVALYLIDPDGSGGNEPITTRDVDGKQFIKVSATHDGETGNHSIRAVFQPPATSTKALTLDNDAPEPESSHTVNIEIE